MSSPPEQYAEIELNIDIASPSNISNVLDGLKAWHERGLILNIDLRLRMLLPFASYARVSAVVKPELLEGLDIWLELGIVSHAEVIPFCRRALTCEYEAEYEAAIATSQVQSQIPIKSADIPVLTNRGSSYGERDRNFGEPSSKSSSESSSESGGATRQVTAPSRVAGMARSLIAEFSLVWLLFLGVFLVVVSSGVLAASQWSQFPPQGQYLILFAYTLAFWGTSFLTNRQGNLQLTTRTLQLVTLLIIPANFWAIDGLGLLTNPIGMLIGAIAGISLSAIAISLLRQTAIRASSFAIVASTLLSWLHLGWGVRFYPLIAVYLGILGVAIATLIAQRQRRVRSSLNADGEESGSASLGIGFRMDLIAGGSAIILLVVRALGFADIRLNQLGLAFGLCGLIVYLVGDSKQGSVANRDPQSNLQSDPQSMTKSQANQTLGIGLLVLGWMVCVGETYPWQALIISCLALWLLSIKLLHSGTKPQLTAIFLLGLQTIWLCLQFIPPNLRQSLIDWASSITATSTGAPILGVLLFPYIWLTLWLTNSLRSRHQSELAQHGEILTLAYGILLTCISVFSPFTQMLNLLLSAGTLLIIESQHVRISETQTGLIYLTHVTGLAAIASAIGYYYPNLAFTTWLGAIVATMLIEWSAVFYIGHRQEQHRRTQTAERSISSTSAILRTNRWAESSWHVGLCLAGLSYVMLSRWFNPYLLNGLDISSSWSILWLITPIALTGLASRRYLPQSRLAIDLSITALVLVQLLTFSSPSTLLISLGVATILMLANMRQHENLGSGLLTIGFGLSFIGALLWLFKEDDAIASQVVFYTNGASLSVLILFLIGHWLRYRRDRTPSNLNLPLNQIYAQSLDFWAIPISVVILTIQTLAVIPTWGMAPAIAADWIDSTFTQTLFSTVIITVATFYRIWQSPMGWTTGWAVCIAAWSVELLMLRGVVSAGGTLTHAGIANLALGLATQLGGDWLHMRRGMRGYPASWQAIPLTYGILGWLFSLSTFSAESGLYSLAAVLICIGIGRREAESNSNFKALIYLSMVGITFSAYQILIYQLSQSRGGSLGDGLVLMGSLSAAIALVYKIGTVWLIPYLKLSNPEIAAFAHFHWFAGTGLLLLAAVFQPSQTGGWLGCIVLVALAIYAAWQGRDINQTLDQALEQRLNPPTVQGEAWVYLAVITGLGSLTFLFYFAFPESRIIAVIIRPYAAAIACIIAYGLFALPWRKWGWSERPWQRSAACLPSAIVVLTMGGIAAPSLLIVATFYAAIARLNNTIRLTYLSVVLSNWALFRFYHHHNLTHSLWYVLALGMSALYILQVEPSLRSPEARETRHTFRLFASGSIGLTALLHSPSDLPMSLVAAALGIVLVLAGLAVHVRAYLFVGTLTFVSVVLIQVWSAIAQYSFLIWAILIGAGIAIILFVANFEARRDRMLSLWQGLVSELSTWE
jgi:hypothetical protein